MLREARVPMLPPPAAATARYRRRRLLKVAAAFLRLVEDAVVYGFLAVLWAHNVGGTFVEVLGRWFCGKGSSVEAAGIAFAACCWWVLVLLFPVSTPLVLMRVREHAKFDLAREEKERKDKEEREKPVSKHVIAMASANEQLPERNRAPKLPKGVTVAPLYAFVPLLRLQCLAVKMEIYHEEGSFMWRVGCVLFDISRLGIAVIVAIWGVRNMVILVTVPKLKDWDDVML